MPPNSANDWRVFWRIIFDVIEGTIRLREELTWWAVGSADRLDRVVEDLPFVLRGDVEVMRDRAVFRGGYLVGRTLALRDFAHKRVGLGVDLGKTSEQVQGENVSLTVDVKLHPFPASADPRVYPIFYMPQFEVGEAGNQAQLAAHVRDNANVVTHNLEWHISGSGPLPSADYRLWHLDGWHRLRVRQDAIFMNDAGPVASPQVGKPYIAENGYKFHVDSFPIGIVANNQPRHNFPVGPQDFYIGGIPDADEPKNIRGLDGDIAYLEFDPNSSCGSCTQ